MSRRRSALHALPWYWQIVCGVGFASLIMLAFATIDRATGAEPSTSSGARSAQHTCDDPDNPCWTVEQMQHNWRTHTHHFIKLNPAYRFPKTFVQAAVRAHRQQVRAGIVEPFVRTDDCATWWCSERYGVVCAGGLAVDTYWGCNGGWTVPARAEMGQQLNDTEKVVIGCGGVTLITSLARPPWLVVVTAASACAWQQMINGEPIAP